MIRLFVATIVCLALQPAGPSAAGRHERAFAAAVAGHATAVLLAPSLDAPPLAIVASTPALSAPLWMAAPTAAPGSARVVARLWLRGQRLLC